MKKSICTFVLWVFLLLSCSVVLAGGEPDDTWPNEVSLDALYMTTVFPDGWTVITQDTVGERMEFFAAETPEEAVESMRNDCVYAVAYSPEGGVALRVIARPGDQTAALYYDIERYTPAMRTAIRADFLDKSAWAVTGYRYSEAEWTNKKDQGRVLNLRYTVRYGEETVAWGRQVYTIRNGMEITLDLRVEGRSVSAADQRTFDRFVADTALPVSSNMPLLPVGLTLANGILEETNASTLSIRGETSPRATVTAWLQPSGGDPSEMTQTFAGAGGTFKLDVELPEPGDYRVYLVASLEGFADSEAGGWVSYDERRLPVSFTSLPEGVYTEAQVVIEGRTIAGVTIQCMEGETNKKVVTGSDGTFSFKLDRTIVGERHVTLSLSKSGFNDRRVYISFDRQWEMADYAKYLDGKVEPLSYANLTERAEKFQGRLVRYTGEVIDVSAAGGRIYVQLALSKARDGTLLQHIIAFTDAEDVSLAPGDSATVYVEVTTQTYAFSSLDENGDEIPMDLPAVQLLAYVKSE